MSLQSQIRTRIKTHSANRANKKPHLKSNLFFIFIYFLPIPLKPGWKVSATVPPSTYEQFIQPLFTSGFTIVLLGGSDSAQTYITADKLRRKYKPTLTEDPFGQSYHLPLILTATFGRINLKFSEEPHTKRKYNRKALLPGVNVIWINHLQAQSGFKTQVRIIC